MNAPRPSWSTALCSALALALVGTSGCIGKRRPHDEQEAAAAAVEAGESPKAEADAPAKEPSPGVPADAKADPEHVRGEASRTPNYGVPVGEARPSKGPADALVTIVEFGAFDCDQCRALQPVLTQLMAKYPKDVRLVFRNLAETSSARRSAQIAAAAHRQGKFWEVHDRLMSAGEDFTAETATQLATDLGLDVEAFTRELRSREADGPAKKIEEDAAVLGVFRGTAPAPLFFVNGRYLDSTATFEDFDRLVVEEKAKAQAFAVEQNVADRTKLYDMMIRGWRGYDRGQNPPPPAPAPAPAGQ